MHRERTQTVYFTLAVLSSVSLYFIGVYLLNQYLMISVDEFWFAHRIYQYYHGLPYRDFAPYKTVLGYYFLLPALLYSGKVLATLFFTKHFITLLNAIFFTLTSFWLARYFSKKSVLINLLLILLAQITLFYSSQIRVDLIGYFASFFALLLVIEESYVIAGVLLGIGFLITQKVIWYVIGTNVSLCLFFFCSENKRSLGYDLIKMNASTIAIVCLYLIFWSFMTDVTTVLKSVFTEAKVMYQLDWYRSSRFIHWQIILRFNPLFFLLWPATFLSLLFKSNKPIIYRAQFLIIIQSLSLLAFLIPYSQVFPYYMQVTIPIFFATYVAYFSWCFDFLKHKHTYQLVSKPLYFTLLIAYLIMLIIVIKKFELPLAYLLIACIPLIISYHLLVDIKFNFSFKLILLSLYFTGLLYPGVLMPAMIKNHHNDYQIETINTIEKLANDNHQYVAGIELIFYRDQPIPGLRHLMGPAITFLYHPTQKLKRVMLASLYEDPHATITSIIDALKRENVLFFVNNYRMRVLPLPIQQFLLDQYQYYGNSIYLYSPHILSGNHLITLKFTGNYRVISHGSVIQLDKRDVVANRVITLQKGKHLSHSNTDYRLQYLPEIPIKFKFTEDVSDRVII